jgi:hypothetical protein
VLECRCGRLHVDDLRRLLGRAPQSSDVLVGCPFHGLLDRVGVQSSQQVDTIVLKRLYALVFIEHGTRRLHSTGVTANPSGAWVASRPEPDTILGTDRPDHLPAMVR